MKLTSRPVDDRIRMLGRPRTGTYDASSRSGRAGGGNRVCPSLLLLQVERAWKGRAGIARFHTNPIRAGRIVLSEGEENLLRRDCEHNTRHAQTGIATRARLRVLRRATRCHTSRECVHRDASTADRRIPRARRVTLCARTPRHCPRVSPIRPSRCGCPLRRTFRAPRSALLIRKLWSLFSPRLGYSIIHSRKALATRTVLIQFFSPQFGERS